MKISAIAACDLQMTIGRDGGMPWDMPADMAHFVRQTRQKPIIMGRRTFESLEGPLKGRLNIVLSRQDDFAPPGVQVAASQQAALDIVRADVADQDTPADELMIIGGAGVYADWLPRCDRIYLTVIHARFDGGDTFFPAFDLDEWAITSRELHPADAKNPHPYCFFTLERRNPGPACARRLDAPELLPAPLRA